MAKRKVRHVVNKTRKHMKKHEDGPALFIPAGILTGFGFGFLFNNLPAGMFIGLGIGFFIYAILTVVKKK